MSAVFWSLPALFFAGIFVYVAFESKAPKELGPALLIVGGAYVAHRITCWIIGGFFAK